jgi:predicted nuclease of restriction endonuclease-like RecB superfamily
MRRGASVISLPERLLDLELCGDAVFPGYLGRRDRPWVERLLETAEACVGLCREEVQQRLAVPPDQGPGWRAWQSMVQLVLRMHGFEVQAPAPPPGLREHLFRLAGALPADTPRRQVLQRAADELGLAPLELERALYADVPAARVLRACPDPPAIEELMAGYNLTLAQSLLQRAQRLWVQTGGQARAVIRQARNKRLLCLAEALDGGGVRVHLSGPLSLFRQTLKYGRAMAAWLPVVVRTDSWKLEARCLVRGQLATWRASQRDPLTTGHAPLRRYDSQVEQRLARDLRRHAPQWEIQREADPVQVGRSIACPDFTLVHPGRGLRVPLEIVGYWTPQYLEHKLALLNALPPRRRWLVCIDRTLAAAAGDRLPEGPPVLVYDKGRVPVEQLMQKVEAWVASGRPRIIAIDHSQ